MLRIWLVLSVLALFTIACFSTGIATQVFDRDSKLESPRIPVTGEENFTGCGGLIIPPQNTDFEQAVVEQTNDFRIQHGLGPLKRVETLDESARYHAADMSMNDYFNHDTYNRNNGKLSLVCDTWSRIEAYYADWEALAENIAAGQNAPEMAMDGWMNSPDHKHNILSASYWEIGVGFFEGAGEYHYYWDQNFGRREGIYPLIIAGEKAKTSSREVIIYIYGDWDEMRLRSDQEQWTNWVPFQTTFNWTLPGTLGTHTVTAELRKSGSRYVTSDGIELVP